MSEYSRPSAELRARVALEKHGFHTTHSLGQNFLLSESLLGHLLDAAEIGPEDRVLEIGPGAGVMTSLLAERAKHVLAVELDRGLEPVLSEVLEGVPNAKVVYQDAMKADLRTLMGNEPYRVVANLPYYITSDVLLKLATAERSPESICIMVQKEAAERVMSVPGSKSWCAMAATVRFYGEARVLEEVPPEAFSPPPHVMSCFVRIDRHAQPPVVPKDRGLFLRLINAAFAMRRKTLANNLKASFGVSQEAAREILRAAGVDDRIRGEALDLEALCRVADALANHIE